MHQAISDMLLPYRCQTPADYKNALKEIVQQIAVLGLSRQGFFNYAAFYGGSALRIGHGLRRFSEDLDFTLLSPDLPYLDAKLKQSGIIGKDQNLSSDVVRELLNKKILSLDIDSARADVVPFIQDEYELEVWSSGFFLSLTRNLLCR